MWYFYFRDGSISSTPSPCHKLSHFPRSYETSARSKASTMVTKTNTKMVTLRLVSYLSFWSWRQHRAITISFNRSEPQRSTLPLRTFHRKHGKAFSFSMGDSPSSFKWVVQSGFTLGVEVNRGQSMRMFSSPPFALIKYSDQKIYDMIYSLFKPSLFRNSSSSCDYQVKTSNAKLIIMKISPTGL